MADSGHFKIVEDIPVNFTRRVGDVFQEGCNNTILVLGTDRAAPGPATVSDGLGHSNAENGGRGAGSITVIAGRKDLKGGNINLKDDDAILYLSMKTESDKNLGLESIPVDVNRVEYKGPAAILKSDVLRLVYRKDVKISIADGKNYIFVDDTVANISLNDKVKILLDSKNEGDAKIWIGENHVDIDGSGNININAVDTTVNIKNGGKIKVGQLSTALEGLIDLLTGVGAVISQTGNLGAPVPMNPDLIRGLIDWKKKWISGDNFKEMSG